MRLEYNISFILLTRVIKAMSIIGILLFFIFVSNRALNKGVSEGRSCQTISTLFPNTNGGTLHVVYREKQMLLLLNNVIALLEN